MTNLNRIRELAGLPLMESVNNRISWKKEDEGKYVTGNWNSSQGTIEFLADGYEFNDGYWKISIEGSQGITKEDLNTVKTAFVEWFNHAKTVDFGDDSVLSVHDVHVEMPAVPGVSIKKFGDVISKTTGLKMIGIDGNANEVTMDFRNTPIPHAAQYKSQQLGKEENPYKTDTM
jgi:hypothetical protein